MRLCQNGGAREIVVENHTLSLSIRSGGCKRIVHFASTFCKKLRRIGALLEILSRCGQRFAKTIDEAPSNSRQWQDATRKLRVITAECLRLAKLTGDEALIPEAERTAAILA